MLNIKRQVHSTQNPIVDERDATAEEVPMTYIILTGPDPTDLGESLEAAGATVSRIEGAVTENAMKEAGIATANMMILTDPKEATAIALARQRHRELRIVVYTQESVPPFAGHLADLILDPNVIDRGVVIEELLADTR